jgi:hypothetical protein
MTRFFLILFALFLATGTTLNAQNKSKQKRIERLTAVFRSHMDYDTYRNPEKRKMKAAKKLYRLDKANSAFYFGYFAPLTMYGENVDAAIKYHELTISKYPASEHGYYRLANQYANQLLKMQYEAENIAGYVIDQAKAQEFFRLMAQNYEKAHQMSGNDWYLSLTREMYNQLLEAGFQLDEIEIKP